MVPLEQLVHSRVRILRNATDASHTHDRPDSCGSLMENCFLGQLLVRLLKLFGFKVAMPCNGMMDVLASLKLEGIDCTCLTIGFPSAFSRKHASQGLRSLRTPLIRPSR